MPTAATARRATPIGAGILHNALEDARDRSNLQALCHAVVCTAPEVSADGIHTDMLRLFDLMRQRGYIVGEPRRPQTQRRQHVATWLVNVTLPAGGASFTWAYDAPNTS